MSNTPASSEDLLDHLSLIQAERTRAFDNVTEKTVQLASGLIAVTVTFRTSLITSAQLVCGSKYLIYVAWVGLALAIALGGMALLARANAAGKYITAAASGKRQLTKPSFIFRHAFAGMSTAFLIALVAFVAFAIINT